jgi:hypothetical protein
VSRDETASGSTIYTSGSFNSEEAAEQLKAEFIDAGAADAKVMAVYNGQLMTLEEAQQIGNGGSSTPDPIENTPDPIEIDPIETTSDPIETAPITNNVEDLRYKVYLGTYQDEVPGEAAEVIIGLMSNGVERKEDAGTIVYTSGNFTNFAEADEFKATVQEAGLQEAKVIAILNGEEIPLDEALEMQR